MSSCWPWSSDDSNKRSCWSLCCGRDKTEEIRQPLIEEGQSDVGPTSSGRTYSKKNARKYKSTTVTPITVNTSFQTQEPSSPLQRDHRVVSLGPRTPVSTIVEDDQVSRLKETIADLSRKLENEDRNNTELRKSLSEAQHRLQEMSNKLQQTIERHKDAIHGLKSEAATLTRTNKELLERIQKLETEREYVSTLTTDQEPSSPIVTTARGNTGLQAKIEELEKLNEQLRVKFENVTDRISEIQQKYDKAVEQHRKIKLELNETISTQNEEIIALKSQLDLTKTRLVKSRRSSMQDDQREKEIQEKADSVGTVEQAKEEILRLEKFIEMLEHRNTKARKEHELFIEKSREENDHLKKQLELSNVPALNVQIERQKKKIADQSRRLHILQSKYDVAIQKIAEIGGVPKTEIPQLQRFDSSTSAYSPKGEADQDEEEESEITQLQRLESTTSIYSSAEETGQADTMGDAYDKETASTKDADDSTDAQKTVKVSQTDQLEDL